MLEALKVGALLPKVAARDPSVFTAGDAFGGVTIDVVERQALAFDGRRRGEAEREQGQ